MSSNKSNTKENEPYLKPYIEENDPYLVTITDLIKSLTNEKIPVKLQSNVSNYITNDIYLKYY